MINPYSNMYYGAMPVNPSVDYNMPVYQNTPVTMNPIIPVNEEMTLGAETTEGGQIGYFCDRSAVIGSSEAAKARERNELKNRIAFLENQVRRYPDNVTFAIQLDKARARLKELDRLQNI